MQYLPVHAVAPEVSTLPPPLCVATSLRKPSHLPLQLLGSVLMY